MIRMIVMSFSEIDRDWLLDNFKRGADLQRDQALIGNLKPSTLFRLYEREELILS